VDLLGLGVLVVLAVHDGDVVAHVLQVLVQIGTVQGHEVISELIDADTDVGAAGSGSIGRSCGGSRSGSRGGAGRAAACSQSCRCADHSRSLQEVAARNHFHKAFSFILNQLRIGRPVTGDLQSLWLLYLWSKTVRKSKNLQE